MANITKGHWPKGKRRHKAPGDWGRLVRAMKAAAGKKLSTELARKIGVHRNRSTFLRRRGSRVCAGSCADWGC